MEELIRKRKPTDVFDVYTMESWLEELASEEGLFVEDWSYPVWATFKKGLPRRVKYRFRHLWNSLAPEQLDQFWELGWEALPQASRSYRVVHLFRAEGDAPELPVEMDLEVSGYQRRLRNSWLRLLALHVIAALLLQGVWGAWTRPVHFLVMQLPVALMVLILLLSLDIRNVLWTLSLRRTLAQMRAGREVRRERSWRGRGFRGAATVALSLICLASSFGLWLWQEGASWEKTRGTLNIEETMLPYGSLAELRGEPLSKYPYWEGMDIPLPHGMYREEPVNLVHYKWSPLAPSYYEELQRRGEVDRNGDATFAAFDYEAMRVIYTELLTEGLAEKYLEEMLGYYAEVMRDVPEQLDVAGVDETFHYRVSGIAQQYLVMRKGQTVVSYMTDDTELDLTEHLELLAAKFD